MMAKKDPVAAAAARKYKPMQSAVPGTTLGPIEIDAFHGGGVCCFLDYLMQLIGVIVYCYFVAKFHVNMKIW